MGKIERMAEHAKQDEITAKRLEREAKEREAAEAAAREKNK